MTVMLDAFLIINAPPPKFLQKRFPLLFSMVHLFHRLYGVDAPDILSRCQNKVRSVPTLRVHMKVTIQQPNNR